MDKFVIYSIFLLCMLLPLTVFSLVTSSVPKLKMRDAAPYLTEISKIKDSLNVSCVDGEDIKKIRGAISHSVSLPVCTVGVDILAVAGLVNLVKDEEVTAGYVGIYIAVVGIFSAVCLYKGVKNAKVFGNTDSFSKRKGILLKFKEIYVPGRPRGTTIYQVLAGTYDDEGKPIVFRTEVSEFVFHAIQNDAWYVIMYQGRPACIIYSKIIVKN